MTLIFSNEDINYIMKTVKLLEDSGIFPKGVTKNVGNETKEQTGRFFGMFMGTLGATLWRNMLSGLPGKGINRADEGVIHTSQGKLELVKFFYVSSLLV